MTFSIKRRPFISRINRSAWTSPRWQHFQLLQNGSCYSSNDFLRRRRATQSKGLRFHFHTGFVFRDLELHSGLSGTAGCSRSGRRQGRVAGRWLGARSLYWDSLWGAPPTPKASQVLRAILTCLKTWPEPERKRDRRAGCMVGLCPAPVHAGEGVLPSELPEGLLREHDVVAYHLPPNPGESQPPRKSQPRREGGAARRCWALAATVVI